MTTPPPDRIAGDPEASACFLRMQSRLRAMGEWRPEYAFSLERIAQHCAHYVRFARRVRGLADADAEDLGEIERTLEGTRQSAREALVLYLIVPAGRARLSALNDEGLDAEIAALCAPGDRE